MAKSDTFQCSVVTPEKTVAECAATFVAFPAHDGEMGVLFNRAPLVCKLGIGQLRIESPAGDRSLFVDGGFAEVAGNRLTILTEQAQDPGDIDRAAAKQALIEARALKITDEASLTARTDAIQRAKAQIKLAQP
ncbi:MAG: ATP synthase F1 subunit epsilon [Planctomycetes bacterium]|nr:ATP synthase F1 subunit epsilon [Planctomycetota bacterium]